MNEATLRFWSFPTWSNSYLHSITISGAASVVETWGGGGALWDICIPQPLYSGHHWGMKFWPIQRGGLISGVDLY